MARMLNGGKFELELKLKENEKSFTTGQKVNAIARILLPEPVLLEDIIITLKGFAKTDWQENIGTETVYRGTSHEYLEKTYAIPVTKNKENLRQFPKGEHLYPVTFTLPKALPTSLETSHGHIKYIMSGRAIYRNHAEMLDKVIVPVKSVVDLNSDQVNGMSKAMQTTVNVDCLLCGGGKITCAFRIDKRGYIPGETILINGQVNNHSRKTISQTKVNLVKKMVYFEDNKTKKISRSVIASIKHGSVKSRNADTWENEELVVPLDSPPDLINCPIIRIMYSIRVEVFLRFALPSSYELINFKLKMGTVKARKPGDYFSGFAGYVPDT